MSARTTIFSTDKEYLTTSNLPNKGYESTTSKRSFVNWSFPATYAFSKQIKNWFLKWKKNSALMRYCWWEIGPQTTASTMSRSVVLGGEGFWGKRISVSTWSMSFVRQNTAQHVEIKAWSPFGRSTTLGRIEGKLHQRYLSWLAQVSWVWKVMPTFGTPINFSF